MKEEKKGVIFDFDGVIADTGQQHKQSWFDLAEKENFQLTEEMFYRTFGTQNRNVLRDLLGEDLPDLEIERMSHWKEQRFRDLAGGENLLMEGAEKLIRQLKEADFLLAIGTSGLRENLEVILKQSRAYALIDVFITSEDIKESKPAPDTFLRAAQKLHLPAHRCVVVEDAVQGVQAARNAGMSVIAVTTSRTEEDLQHADRIVPGVKDLQVEDFERLLLRAKAV